MKTRSCRFPQDLPFVTVTEHAHARRWSSQEMTVEHLDARDGVQLLARHPSCRIIALTSYGQANDRQRSTDAGFDAHLLKPVRVDVLLELLG
jgi:CheY-like chemotaxis protein